MLTAITLLLPVFSGFTALAEGETKMTEEERLASLGFGYESKVESTQPILSLDFERFHLGEGSISGVMPVDTTIYPAQGVMGDTALGYTVGYFEIPLAEPITSGLYLMSFDWYSVGGSTVSYLCWNDKQNGTRHITFAEKVGLIGYHSGSYKAAGLNYEYGTWAHINMFMDFDNDEIYYYVNDEYAGKTACVDLYDIKMVLGNGSTDERRFDNFTIFPFTDGLRKELLGMDMTVPESMSGELSVSLSSKYHGNIFTEFDDVEMDITVTNRTESDLTYDLHYDTENFYYETVDEVLQEKILIKAGETQEFKYKPDVDEKYDLYTLFVTATPNAENTIPATIDREFSVVNVPSEGYKSSYIGTCSHFYKTDRTIFEQIKRSLDISGIGYVRTDGSWGNGEKTKGVFDPAASTQFNAIPMDNDTFLNWSTERGIEKLALWSPTNTLYMPSGKMDELANNPEGLEALEKATEAFARTYKGVINYVELGNEQNYGAQVRVRPKDIAIVNQAAYRGLKKGNPDVFVLCNGLSRADKEWVYEYLMTPGGKPCDAIACHPYQGQGSPETTGWRQTCEDLRDMVIKAGYPDMEIWVTEGNTSASRDYNTSQQHALNLIRQYFQINFFNTVDKFFMHQFQDFGINANSNEHWFYMIKGIGEKNPNGATKTYLALCNFNAMTEDAEPVDVKELDEMWIGRFKKSNGKHLLMMYTDRKCETVTLDLGAKSGTLYDIDGNGVELTSVDGKFTFSLNDSPCYFEYAGDKFDVSEKPVVSLDKEWLELTKGDTKDYTLTLPQGATVEFDGTDVMNLTQSQNGNQVKLTIEVPELPEKRLFLNGDRYKAGMYTEHLMDEGIQIYRDYIYAYVKQNGKTSNLLLLPVEYVYTSADIVVNVAPYDNTGTKYWKETITVTNTKISPISGKLELLNNPELAAAAGNLEFKDLAPGESVSFTYNLPQGLSGWVWHGGKCTLSDGEEIQFGLTNNTRSKHYKTFEEVTWTGAHKPITPIEKVEGEAPVIDGVINEDEWGAYLINAFDKSQVSYGNDGLIVDGVIQQSSFGADADYGGTNDFAGQYFMQWDDEYFYYAAIIHDDVHYQNMPSQRMYYEDTLYLGSSPNMEVRHDTRIECALSSFFDTDIWGEEDKHGKMFNMWTPIKNSNGPMTYIPERDRTDCYVVRKDPVTIYECKVPVEYIFTPSAWERKQMVLTLSTRDYDGDRDKSYTFQGWCVFTDTENFKKK